MLEILISSTVLILALTALRFFLRGKLNPRLQYTLWLLAALRLLLPVSLVRSPVSVMNAVPDVPAAVQRLTAPEDRRAPQTDSTQAPVQTTSEPETAPVDVQTRLKFISRPKRRRTRRRANSSFVTSWRIITRGISSGASCASSASACTGSTPSCGLPRRFPGATASWPATSGC